MNALLIKDMKEMELLYLQPHVKSLLLLYLLSLF